MSALPPLPASLSTPGDTISDILDEKGWSQSELCTRLGYTPKHVSQLINGKAAITEDTALRLERVLGSDMAFWMNREAHYREALARLVETRGLEQQAGWLKELPLKEMIQLKWVKHEAKKGLQVAECLRYFGVASVEAWRASYATSGNMGLAYRASEKFERVAGPVAAWLRQGELVTAEHKCEPYDAASFKALLTELRALTMAEEPSEFVPELQERCAAVGVAVALVPAFKGCPASGVTRWLTPEKAMLVLSLRYRRHDSLWFTFFHEAAHILIHSKKMMFVEGEGRDGLETKEEREADAFAQDLLIPPKAFDEIKSSVLTEIAVKRFANRIGVAPGIVVGRLQKEGLLKWSQMTTLVAKYKWDHE